MSLRLTLSNAVLGNPHKKAQALGRHHARRRARLASGFDYPTQLVGTTPDGNVTVYYDPALGQPGADLAQQILDLAPTTYANCQAFFNVPGQPINVILAPLSGANDGSGGAFHYGCNFNPGGDLYEDAAFGNPQRTNGLVVAELTESFMGAQNMGWDCGGSNGEALSRVLAELLSGGPDGALADFATGPTWYQSQQPNYIDATDPTDQNAVSTGCGVVYLYWMISNGYTAAQITQAGCPDGTLASNYLALTGSATAWADFSAAVGALAGGINSDNPCGPIPLAQAPRKGPAPGPHNGKIVIDADIRTVTVPTGWRLAHAGSPGHQG
jgi:hypothetical protein